MHKHTRGARDGRGGGIWHSRQRPMIVTATGPHFSPKRTSEDVCITYVCWQASCRWQTSGRWGAAGVPSPAAL